MNRLLPARLSLNHKRTLILVVIPALTLTGLVALALVINSEDLAVVEGLKVELITDRLASPADQIAPWPDEQNPTHLFVTVERRRSSNRSAGAPAAEGREAVQVVDLKTRTVETVLYGLLSADGIRVTPWGTLLVTEEEKDGRAWEVFDPLNIRGAFADRDAGASDHPNVVYRPALGTLAWEGIAILPDGTLYAGDEINMERGGGSIFKFVPTRPLAAEAQVDRPEDSPFAAGALRVLKLDSSNAANFSGDQTGPGGWLAIEDPARARAEATSLDATSFFRPEDMVLDHLALAQGVVRMYWANTGSIRENHFGEVMVLIDGEQGRLPRVEQFLPDDGALDQPDNVALHPTTGDVYVVEDFPQGDVWLCAQDGPDSDSLSEGCRHILMVRNPEFVATGLILVGDGDLAYLNLQQYGRRPDEPGGLQFSKLLKIDGLNSALP